MKLPADLVSKVGGAENARKIYKRGLGAYYSSGSRPKVSAHQWAMGRLRSAATGKGGARKADADILKGKE
jgi:hypothetical protein